jgi:hypothetical protein
VYPLHEGQILLGRGEECEIALTDTSVSRVHAEIVGGEQGYELFDRGSANGMHVNGVELAQTFLQPSDVIELGDVLLKFVPKGELYIHPLGAPVAGPESGAPLSFDPASMPLSEPSPAIRKNRITFVASALLLASILLAFAVLHQRPSEEPPPIRAAAPSPAALTVQAAKQLHAEGNLTQAHEKLRELPADSNLRQTTDVMNMERDWADAIFQMVAGEPDPANKKLLLREIAATEGINSEQRKRAAAQLQSLETPSVEVNQLPVEEVAAAPPSGGTPNVTARPAQGEPAPRPKPPGKRPPPKEAPVAAEAPAPSPTPPKEDGLIRKLPF